MNTFDKAVLISSLVVGLVTLILSILSWVFASKYKVLEHSDDANNDVHFSIEFVKFANFFNALILFISISSIVLVLSVKSGSRGEMQLPNYWVISLTLFVIGSVAISAATISILNHESYMDANGAQSLKFAEEVTLANGIIFLLCSLASAIYILAEGVNSKPTDGVIKQNASSFVPPLPPLSSDATTTNLDEKSLFPEFM